LQFTLTADIPLSEEALFFRYDPPVLLIDLSCHLNTRFSVRPLDIILPYFKAWYKGNTASVLTINPLSNRQLIFLFQLCTLRVTHGPSPTPATKSGKKGKGKEKRAIDAESTTKFLLEHPFAKIVVIVDDVLVGEESMSLAQVSACI
jgi:hypothetical protein